MTQLFPSIIFPMPLLLRKQFRFSSQFHSELLPNTKLYTLAFGDEVFEGEFVGEGI